MTSVPSCASTPPYTGCHRDAASLRTHVSGDGSSYPQVNVSVRLLEHKPAIVVFLPCMTPRPATRLGLQTPASA